MNLVTLMGRLTADPEVRTTPSGKEVARYTLAVDRRGKDKGTDFIRCTAFEKAAEFADRYLRKGMKIGVIGSVHTDSYTDRDNKKVYTTEIYAREHYFCESRSDAPQRTEGRSNGHQRGNSSPASSDGFEDIPEDSEGLPFA